MTRSVPYPAPVAALGLLIPASSGLAQAPSAPFLSAVPSVLPVGMVSSAPPAAATPTVPQLTPLENWPRPTDEPKSLFAQPSAPTPYQCAPIPGPYFEQDPLLDPPSFPQPGFVANAEVQAVGAHIYHSLANGVPVGANPVDSVITPISGFNWGASPKIEAGYRLGSGFGEFLLSYRYLGVAGNSTTPGPDALASLHSRLDLNVLDFDWASREFTPWQHWGMKWRVGMREVWLFYDGTLTQPYAAAAAGSGLLQQTAFNDFKAFGGHVALELNRDLYSYVPGLNAVSTIDFGSSFAGTITQGTSQISTTSGYSFGQITNTQMVPSLAGQFGLNYTPPASHFTVFAGGLYEYWWNVGRLSSYSALSRGEMSLTGMTLRLSYNY